MINQITGFPGKQLAAIREVVAEHGTGIVTRKRMEEVCRARPNGNAQQYPPATIFKNEAMKLHVEVDGKDHLVPNTFRIPWANLGLFQEKESKELRNSLKTKDAEVLKAITATLKAKIKVQTDKEAKIAAKNTPAVTPTVTPSTPIAKKGKKKAADATVNGTPSTPSAKKSKKASKVNAATVAASAESLESAAASATSEALMGPSDATIAEPRTEPTSEFGKTLSNALTN